MNSGDRIDVVLLVGTNDLSNRSVNPAELIDSLDDSLSELKRFSNVREIFFCKIPPRFVYHHINNKVARFNELLIERFNATEEFLTGLGLH